MKHLCCLILAKLLILPGTAWAGLYYSGETYAELPAQWRGFLLDHRSLRNLALKPASGDGASTGRTRYLEEAANLEQKAKLSPEDIADLGALYIRLGEVGKALTVLRPAFNQHPNHFYIAANLGTAWQLYGDLDQSAICLAQAVRLSPGKYQPAEELHLKLVRFRLKMGKGFGGLDDLFGVRYLGEKGEYEPGKLAAVERKKLPARAVALVQQLALWLPQDGYLLWQLAELANAHGDVKTAAAMMDGCLTQFGLGSPDLRRHRQLARAAADQIPKVPLGAKVEHEEHKTGLAFRSRRPLVSRLDLGPLPPVSDTGINEIPWELLSETSVDAKYKPTFPKYLQELNGKMVGLNGFIQPLRDDQEMTAFMFIEFPIGCWYCEMPDTTGILFVELPVGKTVAYQRGLVRVVGRLALNATDPEDFLYAIRQARVGQVD